MNAPPVSLPTSPNASMRRLGQVLIRLCPAHTASAPQETNCWPARILEVTADQVCLLVHRRFDPGQDLTLQTLQSRLMVVEVPVRVQRVARDARGDYLVGGTVLQEPTSSEIAG